MGIPSTIGHNVYYLLRVGERVAMIERVVNQYHDKHEKIMRVRYPQPQNIIGSFLINTYSPIYTQLLYSLFPTLLQFTTKNIIGSALPPQSTYSATPLD